MKKFIANLLIMILISFVLFACTIEVKHTIDIKSDGSGKAKIYILFSKEALSVVPRSKIKHDLQKEGWKIVKEEEKENGQYFIFAEKSFSNIQDLNESLIKYTFITKKEGFLTRNNYLELEFKNSVSPTVFYELIVKLPGSIKDTNGERLSKSEVKWSLEGVNKGTKLFAKSSSFIIPTYVWLVVFFFLLLVIIVIVKKRIKPSV